MPHTQAEPQTVPGNKLVDWVATLDLSKAVILAIVAVVASWYDLRSQVGQAVVTQEATKQEILLRMDAIKQESALRWATQGSIDSTQNDTIKSVREDVKDGFRDLKAVVRDQADHANARH
jgi:hypothetical protein